jgi:hypothetical protein
LELGILGFYENLLLDLDVGDGDLMDGGDGEDGGVGNLVVDGLRGGGGDVELLVNGRCGGGGDDSLSVVFSIAAGSGEGANTATRSGISTGREGPVAPVPEPVLPFRD